MNWNSDVKLTNDQEEASGKLSEFLSRGEGVFRLLGHAGTGKTSLISRVVPDSAYVATPTAKAAQVLKSKGIDRAQTLHSLLYQPYEYIHPKTEKPTLGFRANGSSPLRDGGVVVVDEASMVGSGMVEDLLSHPVQVVAVGDPAQLPPIQSKGNRSLLSGSHDVLLTEIHRAALDSPVIALSKYVREQGRLPHSNNAKGGSAIVARLSDAGDPLSYDQIIVGRHATRHRINSAIRDRLGYPETSLPQPGERIIVKRNHPEYGVVNGDQLEVVAFEAYGDVAHARLTDGTRTLSLPLWTYGFQGEAGREKLEEMPFKDRGSAVEAWFAYAITCHSSQGSEFGRVLVVDESRYFSASKSQWLYTAVTRASEAVTVVRGSG